MRVLIAYGTETYNSESLANDSCDFLEEQGFASEVLDLADFAEDTLNDVDVFLLITSTFGDGDPPANAEDAYDFLMSDEAPALNGLAFSVCALGDTAYEHFCQCGKDFDKRLAELGGKRIAPRMDCDTDFDEPWQEWIESVARAMPRSKPKKKKRTRDNSSRDSVNMSGPIERENLNQAAVDERPSLMMREGGASDINRKAGSGKRDSVGTRKEPYLTTVLVNENLNHPFSAKETRHVVIAMKNENVTYKVGDALGVIPRNCPDLVRRVLLALGMERDVAAEYENEWYPLRDILMYKLDLTTIDRRLIKVMAPFDSTGLCNSLLTDRSMASEYIKNNHLIDFVQHVKGTPETGPFVDALRPLAPRLYSIASSPSFCPGEVHLTVDVLRYELNGTRRKGCASSFLAERAGRGVEVAVYVQPTKDFTLAPDDAPIIMIGPGTGIAPFRAFLQEREFRNAPGQSWLFFGAQTSGKDFIYRDELLAWQRSGRLVRLDTAFSRDHAEKVYVQHRLYEHRRSIYHWLESGAYVYVCGDANRMAKDVDAMLQRIVAEEGRMNRESAAAYVKELSKSKRYLKDVY